jgi:predicted Zn-dependent protease/tetratricopeptide (TPR) repeat protein
VDPTPEQFSAPRIQAMVDAHDEAGLAAADVHHAALPSGAEALYLGRALAAYADQRGRRADAEARYAALLRRASDDQAARAAIYCDLAELAHRWQGIAGMEAHLTAATAAATASDDWSLTARCRRLKALLLCDTGDVKAAYPEVEAVVALYHAHADWPGEAQALCTLSYVLLHMGWFAQAGACTARILVGGDTSVLGKRLHAEALSNHAIAIARTGDAEAALPFAEQAVAIRRAQRDPIGLRNAAGNLAFRLRGLKRLDDAERVLEESLAELEKIGAHEMGDRLLNALAVIQADRGDPTSALGTLERALEAARSIGNHRGEGASCINLGQIHRSLGDQGQSAEWFERGIEAYTRGDLFPEAVGALMNESMLIAKTDPARAAELGARAKALADPHGLIVEKPQTATLKRGVSNLRFFAKALASMVATGAAAALSSTPTDGEEIVLVPVGTVPSEALEAARDVLAETFKYAVRVDGEMPRSAEAFDQSRRQYRAEPLLDALESRVVPGTLRVVGVIDDDIFYGAYTNFVFGVRNPGKRSILIGLRRLTASAPHGSALFRRRVAATLVSQVSRSLGLGACPTPDCATAPSNSLEDTDRKSPTLCPRCAATIAPSLRHSAAAG